MALEDASEQTLPDAEKQSASGVTTPDHAINEKDLQVDQPGDEEQHIEKVESAPGFTEEYPTGKALIPIVLSLLIAVFLIAIDMVSRCRYRNQDAG